MGRQATARVIRRRTDRRLDRPAQSPHWDDALPRRLAMATQAARPLCLAIFDIDRFKAINDSHGHVLGDTVLREAARALGDSLRARGRCNRAAQHSDRGIQHRGGATSHSPDTKARQ